MKKKSKEKQKDEKESPVASGGLPDFYELLDILLAQSSKLLRDTLENYKERLESKPTKEKDETTFLLELEKEKNKCVLELLGIAIDQYQRVSADYANFQKRAPRQIAESVAYEKEAVIKTLLPGLDNFNHALAEHQSAENTEAIFNGMRMVYEQILDILKSHGVEQIEAVDQKFDPAVHQAIMQRAEPDKKDGIVLEEFQKGYKLNGRTIRPSKVIVNKLSTEPQAEDEEPVTDEAADADQTTQED